MEEAEKIFSFIHNKIIEYKMTRKNFILEEYGWAHKPRDSVGKNRG